jgi:hypothetical protein
MGNIYSSLEKLNIAFGTQAVSSMTPEQHAEFISTLCNQEILNPTVQHRAVVRMLAINHVQTARVIAELQETIKRLNEENGRVARQVWVLTCVCAACGLVQAFGVLWMILHTR